MSTEILKDFLIAVGFKLDESSYKRAQSAIDKVEKTIGENDKRDENRVTAEQRRHEVRKRNADGLALALGGVAAAAATAATVVGAAMVKMAGGFDNLYFVSQRTGASANNLKSLGYAFSQVGSTAESALQAVESFAKARRTNPGINGMLRSYGVDTRGDTSDVLMRGIDAIQTRHPYYTGAQVAQQLGISEDQFQTLTKYKEQIKAYRVEYERLQKTLNVNSDETTRASASIQRSIGSLSAIVGVLMEKLYTTLAPVLERIVKGFRDWIEAHPEQVEKIMRGLAQAVETVGNGLMRLGDWLGDEENQKRLADYWDKFLKAVTETAKQVKDLLEMLFKIGRYLGLGSGQDVLGTLATRALGNQQQVAEGDTSQGTPHTSLLRRGWNAVRRAFGGGGGDSDAGRYGEGDVAAGTPGKFRRQRSLTERDLSDAVINTIAGEAKLKTAGGADAVINNMFNRLGTRGWGPSNDLQDVARAPGQYAGYRRASAAEAEYIRGRIRAIASGGVPDNTNGSNSFRANYYRGPWYQRFGVRGKDVGGNIFGYDPSIPNGPYSPYREPKADVPSNPASKPKPSAPRMNMTPGGFNVMDYFKTPPMGSASSTTNNNKSVSQNNPVNVTVHGAGDPQATGTAVARAVGQANDMSLRNVQTAIR